MEPTARPESRFPPGICQDEDLVSHFQSSRVDECSSCENRCVRSIHKSHRLALHVHKGSQFHVFGLSDRAGRDAHQGGRSLVHLRFHNNACPQKHRCRSATHGRTHEWSRLATEQSIRSAKSILTGQTSWFHFLNIKRGIHFFYCPLKSVNM